MKKLILALVTCVSITALAASPALASWGGGTGDDAVQVVGDVTLVDTKYYITGDLTALGATPSQRVLDAVSVSPDTWELDFGKDDMYMPAGFGEGTYTIQGKLCEGGEIDVYKVGETIVRTEGPSGPPGGHPLPGGPPGQDDHPNGGHPQGGPPGQTGDHPNGKWSS